MLHFITLERSKYIILIAVALFLGGIIRFPADDLRLEILFLFKLSCVATVAICLWRYNMWLSLFLVFAAFSMICPFYTKVSCAAFENVFYGMVLILSLNIMVDTDNVGLLLNAICLIAFANILFLLLQYFDMDPLFIPVSAGANPPTGLMGNRNFVNALLAFCLPAFFRKRWVYFVPIIVLGLIMSKSSGGTLAAMAGVIFYFALKKKNVIKISALILAACVLFILFIDPPVGSFAKRIEAWHGALPFYKQHWAIGCGLGHWKIVFKVHELTSKLWWSTAHNEVFQGAFEMGVGFIAILIGYAISAFRKFRKEALVSATALIIIFLNSLVNFPFHIATTAMVAVIWMAIYDIQTNKNNDVREDNLKCQKT